MQHLDFTDFSSIESLMLPELPGCPRATMRDAAMRAFAMLCEDTRCFKEEIAFEVTADRDYDMVSPHNDTVIIGWETVKVDGAEMLPGDYEATGPNRITFNNDVQGKCRVLLLLKPLFSAQAVPSDILLRWGDVVAAAAKANLMLMPETPWSNPPLGQYYQQAYNRDSLRIAGDVRNQFSIDRTGRTTYKRSVYGI